MRTLLLAAASLALLAGPALAQGNSPYNSSGSQAGGPRGGMERAVQGRAMEQGAMAPREPMAARRSHGKRKATRRMRRGM